MSESTREGWEVREFKMIMCVVSRKRRNYQFFYLERHDFEMGVCRKYIFS